jgi:hypothetical protein
MNVFIEQLYLPLEEEWARFIPPLQQSCLRQMVIGDIGDAFQVGRFLIWGVRIRQDSSEEIDLKCGVLVAKLIDSLYPNGNRALLLSIASISFVAPKISLSLGPLLLQHVLDFASEHGWAGVHIGCPQNGQYGDFVRQLTASVGSWTRRPGKVVIRLSDIQRVGPLLTRLEKAVERKKGSAQWQIEPYDPKDIEQWKDRIAFSKVHQLGVPWDPDDDSYDWEPACEYSRVLKSNNTVIGWLICHFVGDDILRYGKLWVDPGWEQSGAPLAMLCDVMRSAHFQSTSATRHGEPIGFPISSGCFISHPTNNNLHRLVTSKFRPVCDTWTELENYYCYLN